MKKAIGLLVKITSFVLLILLCCAFTWQEQEKKAINEEEMKAFIEKILDVYNKGNLALADEICDPAIVVHYSASPEDIVGIEAFKNWITTTRTMYSDFSLTFDEIVVKGDKLITRWTATGTNTGPLGELPPTGKKIHITGLSLAHVKDKKIVEEWIVYNVLEMFQQLGFTVVPPQVEKQE